MKIIDISKSTDKKQSGIRTLNQGAISKITQRDRQSKWGKYNIPIYTNKECTNTIESSTNRHNFYIHGGDKYGDNGGIDLAKEDARFFNTLESLKQEYKEVLDSIKDDKDRIVVKLEVGYENAMSINKAMDNLEYELYLIEAEVANIAREIIKNINVREAYIQSIKEMSKELLKKVEKEQDIHKRNILAKQLAKDANRFRNEVMNNMRSKSTYFGRSIAEAMKKDGKLFEEMIEKKIQDLKYNKPFEQLTKQEQTKVFEAIIKSSGNSRRSVNIKIAGFKYFGRFLVIISFGAFAYDVYLSENKVKTFLSSGTSIGLGLAGGASGGMVGYAICPFTNWFFVGCIALMSGAGAYFGTELGDFIINDYFNQEINDFLKEYNLD